MFRQVNESEASLRDDLTWLFGWRLSVLLVVIVLTCFVLVGAGEMIFSSFGLDIDRVNVQAASLRAAVLCLICFSGALVAHVVGKRRGQLVGGTMIAITLRTGGVAVGVVALWLAFEKEVARVEIAVLGVVYLAALAADTLAWLFETKARAKMPADQASGLCEPRSG